MSDKGYKRVVVELPTQVKDKLDFIVDNENVTIKDYLIDIIQSRHKAMMNKLQKREEMFAADQSGF